MSGRMVALEELGLEATSESHLTVDGIVSERRTLGNNVAGSEVTRRMFDVYEDEPENVRMWTASELSFRNTKNANKYNLAIFSDLVWDPTLTF